MSGRRFDRWLRLGMVAAVAIGCGSVSPNPGGVLRVKGSDTMLILNRRLAEGFMRSHPGVSVIVEGGGTSTGVEALLRSEVAICAASRPLAPSEVERLFDVFGTLGARMPIARDALSVWVHPGNAVRKLSLDELGRIFAGTAGVWSDFGGAGREITVVVRPPASGTFRFFRDRVLAGGPYSNRTITAAATRDVVEWVAANPGAIGYGGAAYGTVGVRALAIDGVLPTAELDDEGEYPLTRHLVFYTVAPPEGLSREFIDWCQGAEGQMVVAEIGYLPLWRRR